MRIPLLAAAALLASAAPTAAAERISPEARLDRAVQGRVAGEAVNCIDTRRFTSARIIDRTAIVYEAPGGTLWVNRPRGGARSLDDWDVLVTRQFSGSLCRGDIVRLFDPSTMTQTGTIFLGDFVPYRRAD
ncbi:MAG TPA: hypothetical protein VF702_07955 [Allosphingosinicella sp.]|jgi:hypothetical protein